MKLGDVLEGRFQIDRLAGKGGAGVVFRGVDRETGAAVAIKAGHADDPDLRFQREVETLAALRHPTIVNYLGHGMSEGELYLVMEWLDGEDLGTRLKAGRLTLDESVSVARQVAVALAAAHEKGIVHRDVKPSNVFLVNQQTDRVKLLDFGIARRAGMATLTTTGILVGTPSYMAPEQARGASDLHARVDVYGLGALLFHCVTGRAPFAADSIEQVIARILTETAPRLRSLVPEVSAELDALVARMLSKDPLRRPADGRAVHAALVELEPNDPRALSVGAAELFYDGQRERALEWAARAAAAAPDDPAVWYNVACTYAGMGEKEEALRWLEKMFGRGMGGREWALHDPDFDLLRDDPRFRALVAKAT